MILLNIFRGNQLKGVSLVVEPTEEFKAVHHVIDTPVQTFLIMADLSPEGM